MIPIELELDAFYAGIRYAIVKRLKTKRSDRKKIFRDIYVSIAKTKN